MEQAQCRLSCMVGHCCGVTYIPSVCTHAVPGAARNKAGQALGVSRGIFDDDGNAVNVHAVASGELYLHELPVRWTHYASQCLPLRQSPQGQPWRRRRTRTNERAWRRARRDSRGQNSTERTAVLPTRDNAWLLRQNQVPPHHHATIPPLCGLMYMHVWSDVCGLHVTQRVLGSRLCNVKEHGHYGRQCTLNVPPSRVKKGYKGCGKKHTFTGL